jgi:hypothetical protein
MRVQHVERVESVERVEHFEHLNLNYIINDIYI